MRAKKPKVIDIYALINETAQAYSLVLTSLTNKVVEVVGFIDASEAQIRLLKVRIAALEKAESDRQAHEVIK